MMEPVFELDGETFRVDVTALQREFSKPLGETAGKTLDGTVRYQCDGVYCHYTMTVRPRPGCEQDILALWDYVMRPCLFNCRFFYGDSVIDQYMYVTDGKQALVRANVDGRLWGELTLRFIATEPGGAA